MENDKKPVASSTVVLREDFDDWALLFDPDTGEVFGMNPVSVFIWKLLDGRHTVDDISNKIKKTCEDAPEKANEHVRQFISSLQENGFVGYEQ